MSDKAQSLFLGVITILLWGSLATFGQLLNHLPPFYVLGMSFLFGSIPAWIKPRELFPSLKVSLWGISGFFGYHFFLFYSFRYAPALEANLINYLWPVLLVILSPAFFKQDQIKWYHIIGAALSIIGCVFLMLGKGAEVGLEHSKGYALALAAAFTWPIYSIGKKLMGPVSVWAIGGFCLGASILCFLTHALIEVPVVLQWSDAWKLMLMGLGPFGIAFYCWDLALRKGDTKLLGALAYLTPVISTAGLVFFGNQHFTSSTALAMVLIIGGASAGLLDFLPPKR